MKPTSVGPSRAVLKQEADADLRQTTEHAKPGQYNDYVFRHSHGSRPGAPSPHLTGSPLKPRPKPKPRAQSSQQAQSDDQQQTTDVQDDIAQELEQARALEGGGEGEQQRAAQAARHEHKADHAQQQQAQANAQVQARAKTRLRARLPNGQQNGDVADAMDFLEDSDLPGVQTLFGTGGADGQDPGRERAVPLPRELMDAFGALVLGAVATEIAERSAQANRGGAQAGPGGTPGNKRDAGQRKQRPSLTSIILAASKAVLLRQEDASRLSGAGGETPVSLGQVKEVLIARSQAALKAGTLGPVDAARIENALALLPLMTLNIGRPRTDTQRLQAADRNQLILSSRGFAGGAA